jgi:N-acetylglucosaminyldiphosphoundecaprenol N-acetyl-beta-D-mannosaminyltransferase
MGTGVLESISILGVPVHLATDYLDWLVWRAEQRQGCHVVTLNAEMTMRAEQDPQLTQIIRQADLVIPDGAGVVLYLNWLGQRVPRCPGIELAESLLEEFDRSQLGPVCFFGGAPGVAEEAAAALKAKFPGLAIVDVQHGYLADREAETTFLRRLEQLQPRLILVGLGVPRQEFWIAQHRHLCPDAIWVGIGGSFDIWSGSKARAPEWLRNNHLEWAYRLYQEPWRWKRMLALPHFAWRAFWYRLSHGPAVSQ